jgi:hypothetical protein
MNRDPKIQQPREWIFRGFVTGAVLGAFFGALTVDFWNTYGPNRIGISAGFWGLVFGVLGLIAGVVHRISRKK